MIKISEDECFIEYNGMTFMAGISVGCDNCYFFIPHENRCEFRLSDNSWCFDIDRKDGHDIIWMRIV